MFQQILSLILLSLVVFPSVNHASGYLRDFDLNKPCNESEEIIDDTSNSSGADALSVNISSSKTTRSQWRPFIPTKVSEDKKEYLRTVEYYLQSSGEFKSWDYSRMKSPEVLRLCVRVWGSLKVEGIPFLKNGDSSRMCDEGYKISVPRKDYRADNSAGTQYICRYRYLNEENPYYADLIRCNCKYRSRGTQRALKSSKTYFLLHRASEKMYLIYSAVDPNNPVCDNVVDIHLVDYFRDG